MLSGVLSHVYIQNKSFFMLFFLKSLQPSRAKELGKIWLDNSLIYSLMPRASLILLFYYQCIDFIEIKIFLRIFFPIKENKM